MGSAARTLTRQIRRTARDLADQLDELTESAHWEELGYPTFRDYYAKELAPVMDSLALRIEVDNDNEGES